MTNRRAADLARHNAMTRQIRRAPTVAPQRVNVPYRAGCIHTRRLAAAA